MAIVTFDDGAAPMLKWVLAGADNNDYGQYVVISVDGDDSVAQLSTNTPLARTLTMDVEDAQGYYDVAFAASRIAGLANDVDEGEHLVIHIDEDKDKIYVSCGSTTITLDNLYDVCPVVSHVSGNTSVTTTSAFDVVGALSTAAKLSPRGGGISLDCDTSECVVGVISNDIHSYEAFSSTLSGDESYHTRISAKKLSPLNAVTSMDYVEDVTIKQSPGVVSFVFPVTATETFVTSMSMSVATVVEHYEPVDNPCDEITRDVARFSKSELKGALSPLTSVVSHGVVTVDTTGGYGIVLTITSNDTAAKTVVVDATVLSSDTFSVQLSSLMSAIKNVSTAQLEVGTVDYHGQQWCVISGNYDDDNDADASDIIIATPTVD